MNINQNHSGQGNNVVNIGNPQRHLNQGDADKIREQIPQGEEVVVWSNMGNPESEIYAREIAGYLNNSGYKISLGVGTLSKWGIVVKNLRGKYNVFVGNNPEQLS